MKLSQVAVQLYTLRNHLKTPTDIAATLRKVRAIGYEAVQLSGLGPIEDEELMRILDGEGLICCATHEGSTEILDQVDTVIAHLQKIGCRYTAYAWPAGIDFGNPDHITTLARKLDASAAAMARAGQVLTYHNHSLEFVHYQGKPVLEYIYSSTSHLQAEIDTYWVQAGGGNPVTWCERLKGRLPLLHIKDYACGADGKPFFAEIGHGNLDWDGIISAADGAGCLWYIVEQDTCPSDPFECLTRSFEYLGEKYRSK